MASPREADACPADTPGYLLPKRFLWWLGNHAVVGLDGLVDLTPPTGLLNYLSSGEQIPATRHENLPEGQKDHGEADLHSTKPGSLDSIACARDRPDSEYRPHGGRPGIVSLAACFAGQLVSR